MHRRLPVVVGCLVLVGIVAGCTDIRKREIPKTKVEEDTGEKDRRGFKVYSGGTEVGSIFQIGKRFVPREGGTYEIQDADGYRVGFIVGASGEVYDFRGKDGANRKVDTVDVTTDTGLAQAAQIVLELPPGVKIRSASFRRSKKGGDDKK